MSFQNKTGFNIRWDMKTFSFFILLLLLPNVLGMINISTPFGFNIHFFQIAIFIAALVYGPFGGALSGTVGSVYAAVMMHNPYLIVGNAILGFFVGFFFRNKLNSIFSIFLAFLIQIPWLIITDSYFMHMPLFAIGMLIISLFVSNIIWGLSAIQVSKQIRMHIK